MENKYKKTLAKIAAVFSIIAVFSFGFVDKASYASNQADNLEASIENLVDNDMEELKSFMDGDGVEEIQEGAESPYSKEITLEHIGAVRSISGESDDVYRKMIKAYEAQQTLRAALKDRKAGKITDYELAAHGQNYQNSHKEYSDARQIPFRNAIRKTHELTKKCGAGKCTNGEKEQLNKYKLFVDASVSDLKVSISPGGNPGYHKITTAADHVPDRELSVKDKSLVKNLAKNEQLLDAAINRYNTDKQLGQARISMNKKGSNIEEVKKSVSEKNESNYKKIEELNNKRKGLLVDLGIIGNKSKSGSSNVIRQDLENEKSYLSKQYSKEYRKFLDDGGKKYDQRGGLKRSSGEEISNEKLAKDIKDLQEARADLRERSSLHNSANKSEVNSGKNKIEINTDPQGASVTDYPRITQEDVDVLKAKRDAAGAEYKKNLESGVNDPRESDAAERLFSLSKNLLAKQEALGNAQSLKDRTASDHAKFKERVAKVEKLEKEYDVMKAEYSKIKANNDSKGGLDRAKAKQANVDSAEKARKATKSANEKKLKELMDSGDDAGLENFLNKNPSMRGEVYRIRNSSNEENNKGSNYTPGSEPKPEEKIKKQQSRKKVKMDEGGSYIRGSNKSKNKSVISVYSAPKDPVKYNVEGEDIPSSSKRSVNSTAVTTENNMQDNRLNLINEALSQ